jgi:hypothetical protein
MKNLLSQQINESSELTYGGAAIAILIVIAIFTCAFVWARKGSKKIA